MRTWRVPSRQRAAGGHAAAAITTLWKVSAVDDLCIYALMCRALLGELVGRAASVGLYHRELACPNLYRAYENSAGTQEQHLPLVRGFASLVGSGIPSPRPDVALQLSTPHGGHINRMILSSESLVELDSILYKHRKKLRPANIGAASVKLEQLYR